MAKICDFCGKKAGLISSETYEETVNGEKLSFTICGDCYDDIAPLAGDIPRFEGADVKRDKNIAAALKHIDNNECTPVGKKYIEFLVDKAEKEKIQLQSFLEKQKVLDAAREQKEKEEAERQAEIDLTMQQRRRDFKCTTGYGFEGYRITEYLGIVTNESLVGTGIFSEIGSSINDFFGTESSLNKSKLSQSKLNALERIKADALRIGANAIIGIDFDIMTFSNNTIVTSVNGTAVWIEKE